MPGKFLDFIYYNTATCCGIGRLPHAPGTFGSAFAVILVWLFFPVTPAWQLVTIATVSIFGIAVANWMAEALNDKDPSMVVVDELAGVFITFFMVPNPSWQLLLIGFILFRIFDIWKPWPVSAAEKLPGGLGIMLDDMVAGVFACILLHISIRAFF